ncbi:MAG: hypothetical protein HOQ05_05700 [Corynebacteriales bacterium]|nr:hypothetical protein [Mycobacteriales bacterium]
MVAWPKLSRSANRTPTVTVLTTTHIDVLDLLDRTASSLVEQKSPDGRPVPELWWSIGVDGNADDAWQTLQAAKKAVGDHPIKDRIRANHTIRKRGDTCPAQNMALTKGFHHTDFTLLMDGDDWFTPTGVSDLVNGCRDENVWWSVGAKERANAAGEISPGADISHLVGTHQPGQLYPHEYAHIDNLVAASALAVRTPLLLQVGISPFPNSNDTALLAKLSAVASGAVIPDVVVTKLGHENQKTKDPQFLAAVVEWHNLALRAGSMFGSAYTALGGELPRDANRFTEQHARKHNPAPLKRARTKK